MKKKHLFQIQFHAFFFGAKFYFYVICRKRKIMRRTVLKNQVGIKEMCVF